jgi:hypothetical protein
MKLNQVFGMMCLCGLIIGIPMFANGDPPLPWGAIPGVMFWVGLIGYFAARPSKQKAKEEQLQERLRELELQNRIAEAEARLESRKRDA